MVELSNPALVPCPPKPDIQARPPLMPEQARQVANVFKILAGDTRLRLLHALIQAGELCVTDLADAVDMKTQAVSNQLQRLVSQGILGSRRDGNNMYYRVENQCVVDLLERGLCLTECAQDRMR